MTEAQVWTVLAILAATPVLTTTLILTVIGTKFDGLDTKFSSLLGGLDARLTDLAQEVRALRVDVTDIKVGIATHHQRITALERKTP